MLETEEQRRWWFATHPEYSSSRRGGRSGRHREVSSDAGRVRPKDVDAYVDEALKYESGSVADLLKSVKRNFGTEGERRFRLAGSVKTPDETMLDASRMGGGAGGSSAMRLRPQLGGGGGPGKWVEVQRGPYGLAHQSKMSGRPIRESGGKLFIKEYELNGVKFDDYRDGKLYEYKGRLGHLFDGNNELKPWIKDPKQFRDEALRQVKAANGIPVIWRVGRHQVEAVRKAVGKVHGITVEP